MVHLRSVGAVALVFCALLVAASADCPDRDYRCRVAVKEDWAKKNGVSCSVGGGANEATGLYIEGKCVAYEEVKDGVVFAPAGTMNVGTCYQFQFGDCCGWQASCRPCRSLVEQCGEKVAGCKRCDSTCTNTRTVQEGESCWKIANDAGMALNDLLSLNSGVNCDDLQPNQKLCLAKGQGGCTQQCEAIAI